MRLLARSAPTAREETQPNNYFKSTQWSPDGQCIITNSADNGVRTWVVPPTLTQDSTTQDIQPSSTYPSYEAVDAVTCWPGFNLSDPAAALVLCAVNDHPIRFTSALHNQLVASYPLVNPMTEAFIKPHSLTFTADGTNILAGSENLVSMFDVSRPGDGPVSSFQTGPKSKRLDTWANPATSMRGIVSTLAIDTQYDILAVGTLTRHVGLYDSGGKGECVGVFTVQDTAADLKIGGRGITQVIWSPCGRYLYIAERRSDGVMIYDIRQSGRLLGWLEGRCADTNQRLNVNLTTNRDASTVYAGGKDGYLRSWVNSHLNEGANQPTMQQKVHHDAVTSTHVHRDGKLVVTASGQRHFPAPESDNKPNNEKLVGDCTLKVWDTDLTQQTIHA